MLQFQLMLVRQSAHPEINLGLVFRLQDIMVFS